jgi:predicted dithiol-disulfide oxidoreductase (DUF899 family)
MLSGLGMPQTPALAVVHTSSAHVRGRRTLDTTSQHLDKVPNGRAAPCPVRLALLLVPARFVLWFRFELRFKHR